MNIYISTDKEYGAKPIKKEVESTFDKFNFYFEELSEGEEIILGGKRVVKYTHNQWKATKAVGSEDGRKEIWATGSILDGNSSGRFFRDYLTGRYETDGYGVLYKVYGIGDDKFDYRYFTGPQKIGATKGKYFQGVPLDKLNSENNTKTLPINNFYDLAGSFGNCRTEGGVDFRSGKKPEALIEMLLSHFSKKGDLVLDSFLGSGSTAAVAHKMGRRWIGVELGEHAKTHCYPRLKMVCDGSDQGGISKAQNWKGGGGFKFYTLAPSLLNSDKFGNLVINKEYNADMLAAAMAKQEGFRYSPDSDKFWKQGHASDSDYIYTTTQFMTVESLAAIAETMADGESLLICSTSFQKECRHAFRNITIKKIPQMLLGRCAYDKDSYALNIIDLPQIEADEEEYFEEEEFETVEELDTVEEQRSLFE